MIHGLPLYTDIASLGDHNQLWKIRLGTSFLAIPKGLSPPARGWRVREPTPGPCPNEIINRNAVVAFPLSRPRATLAASGVTMDWFVLKRSHWPAHTKTRTHLPGASASRWSSWTAAGSVAPRRFRACDGPQKLAARACVRKRRRRWRSAGAVHDANGFAGRAVIARGVTECGHMSAPSIKGLRQLVRWKILWP